MTDFVKKYKNLLIGFSVVLLVMLFAGAVRYLAVEDNDKIIAAIQKNKVRDEILREQAQQNEIEAKAKADSILILLRVSRENEIYFTNELRRIKTTIYGFRDSYFKSLNELKNIQNEKDVTYDATVSEQLDFITKYRYSEYQRSAD